ncbi:hypothetical protein BDB01DRAFT_850434 [Pilobolus umbonatus]|nr:hypothetical protein BDB01DRAFT_850434 [Pilobolus umbonatus]
MSRDLPNGSYSWNPLDPDPGTFTKLCSLVGVQGIQVEPIDLMDQALFHSLRPVYGFMLLVRHHPNYIITKEETVTYYHNEHIYFNNQVIDDAYAMHGMLNILLNCDMLDIGPELYNFKKLTYKSTPAIKGLTLTNTRSIREAHNSLGGPRRKPADLIYHPICYIQHSGFIWELDSLRKNPVRLGVCNEQNWLDVMHIEISRKYNILQKQNLMASVWGVIENRKLLYQRRLIGKSFMKREIEHRLDEYHPEWRIKPMITKWEEEYMHVMSSERNRRGLALSKYLTGYCNSLDQLPLNEQNMYREQIRQYIHHNGIMDAWLQVQDDSLRLYEHLGVEDEKDQLYELNVRKKQHNYIPFIQSFIQGLLEEGLLQIS